MHQNLINNNLYQGATEHKVLSISSYGDIHTDIFLKWSNRVKDISKHINLSKIRGRKFSRIEYILHMNIEEINKSRRKKTKINTNTLWPPRDILLHESKIYVNQTVLFIII